MPSQENITSLTSFPRARITFYYLHTLILYHVTKDGMRINQSKHRTTSQILTRIWLKPKKGGVKTIGIIGRIRLLWLISHKINLLGIVCTWCYREFVLYMPKSSPTIWNEFEWYLVRLLTCSRHRNHQNIPILHFFQILFTFCFLLDFLWGANEELINGSSPYFWSRKKIEWTKFSESKLENRRE